MYNYIVNIDIQQTLLFVSLVINVIIVVLYFQTLTKLKETIKASSDLYIKGLIADDVLSNIKTEKELDIHQENFIKFLSDSRDWAFDYIDNVQKELKDFIETADKEFAYFDSYGILSEDQLFYDNMKTISAKYKKLKNLLPEDIDDRR